MARTRLDREDRGNRDQWTLWDWDRNIAGVDPRNLPALLCSWPASGSTIAKGRRLVDQDRFSARTPPIQALHFKRVTSWNAGSACDFTSLAWSVVHLLPVSTYNLHPL